MRGKPLPPIIQKSKYMEQKNIIITAAETFAEKEFPSGDPANAGKHDAALQAFIAGEEKLLHRAAQWLFDYAPEYASVEYYEDGSPCTSVDVDELVKDFTDVMKEG